MENRSQRPWEYKENEIIRLQIKKRKRIKPLKIQINQFCMQKRTQELVMKSGRKFRSIVYASGILLTQIQQRDVFSLHACP